MEGDLDSVRSVEAAECSSKLDEALPRSKVLGSMHRRLWSWRWSSGADSAMDRERCGQGGAASPPPSQKQAETAVAWRGGFPAARAGVAIFTLAPRAGFTIAVGCEDDMKGTQGASAAWLGVRVGSHSAELVFGCGGDCGTRVLGSIGGWDVGYGDGRPATFWLSFDPYNRTVKYGKGSRLRDRTFLSHTFTRRACAGLREDDIRSIDRLLSPMAKLVELRHYGGPSLVEHTVFDTPLLKQRMQSGMVTFDEEPLLADPSPRLLEPAQMVLQDFARDSYSLPMHLAPAAQALAQQVMQPWLSLEAASQEGRPCLTDAIRHSLDTPGAFLHKLLQEKIAALPDGVPACASQLSVALAPADGSAPGPAFSLELLPAGHCSLPHDNARTHGVLRVLRGFLDVSLYDEDLAAAVPAEPLDEVELDAGDAMWFSPTTYQTHAMRNDSGSFCCYLLARRYAEEDHVRWPYIRSQRRAGEVVSSRSDADCTFQQLQAAVTAELELALANNPRLLDRQEVEERSALAVKDWVERSDSAFEEDLNTPEDSPKAARAHRYGCTPLSMRWKQVAELPASAVTPKAACSTAADSSHSMAFIWP